MNKKRREKTRSPQSPYFLGNYLDSNTHPEDQKEYVMFHGTDKKNAELIKREGFKPSKEDVSMLGAGVYVTRDIQKAIKYPLGVPNSQRRVLVVRVNVGKVKIIDRQDHPMQKTWHTVHGYDTAWVPPDVDMVRSNQEEDCVYDPKRIKVIQVLKVNERNISKYIHLKSGMTPEDKHFYVMYHGTTNKAAIAIRKYGFTPSSDGMLGAGVYVSRDIRKVIKYPIGDSDSNRMVLKLKVNVGKVKMIDSQDHPMQKTWHTVHGYDTAWVPPGVDMVESNQEEDCVYDPKRITVLTMLKVPILRRLNPSLQD